MLECELHVLGVGGANALITGDPNWMSTLTPHTMVTMQYA